MKTDYIKESKEIRKELDVVLQKMKSFNEKIKQRPPTNIEDEKFENHSEVIANNTISIRDLESSIMRQGMVLKNIGNPNPYPESYNPDSSKVDPTADGLKL